MAILSENDIKSELSYAYLHAVAAQAGLACEVAGRHSDGAGVDATVRALEQFAADSILTEFTIDVQLKATSAEPAEAAGRYSHSLTIKHYDKLRTQGIATARILVVLFLPPDPESRLSHSAEALISRRCAYWVSLTGAPASENDANQTVYLPLANVFSPDGLRQIMTTVSRQEAIAYEG